MSTSREAKRVMRKARVRKRVKGTDQCPRLSVYRSLRFTYVQAISDESRTVIAAVSSKDVSAGDGKSAQSVDAAKVLGTKVANALKAKNISKVIFDRNGYLFHGRVKAVADGAREAGLEF